MAEKLSARTPRLKPEQRRAAAGQFERANQVLTTGKNLDYGLQLLVNCCKLDPTSLIYRQTLRKAQKSKYNNNLRGSSLALLTSLPAKLKLNSARRKEDHLRVLEIGESILQRNPWDLGTQLAMAESFEALGLPDLALWTLDQARQKDPNHPRVNRALAQLYEQRGAFTQAMALWEMVRRADPNDTEAQNKAKDLAASETIAKGHYDEAVHRKSAETAKLEETQSEMEVSTKAQPSLPTQKSRTNQEVANLEARIKSDPTDPQTYLNLAFYYRRRDQLDKAFEVLKRGLGPTSQHFDLSTELADLEVEPFRRNLKIAEAKLVSDPTNQQVRAVRSRLLREINARELDLYRRKSDRYPTDMSYRFEMGVRLLRGGQIDEAIRELQTARSDPRHHADALVYLGHCFKQRKNWRLAQRNFEEALQHLSADDALRKDVLFELANGHAEAGDLASAVEQGYELANLDFNYRNIGRLLDDWQARIQSAST